MTSLMSYEEFSEFYVETIVKHRDHFQYLADQNEEITVNVIEGFSNFHCPVTVCTQMGGIECRLKWNASTLCIPIGIRGEFDIFLMIAQYTDSVHLRAYSEVS